MRVKRITANIKTADIVKAEAFYHDVLGLECIMDHGWIRTYGLDSKMTVQVSFDSEGGSGTPVPDLSIEVDDVEITLAKIKKANIPIEYGQRVNYGEYGDFMSVIHSENLSISYSMYMNNTVPSTTGILFYSDDLRYTINVS